MDIDFLRGLYTVLALLTFAVIALWAWSRGNHQRFEEAARLPLLDDDTPAAAPLATGNDKP